MARPLTVSDDDIFEAAQRVLKRRGPDGFSIAEVATEVGLSRAAIILRFRSTEALKLTLLTRLADQFDAQLQQLPKVMGGDGLLHIGAFVGGHVGSREGSAKFFANYSVHVRNRSQMKLEYQRGEALSKAISQVMPTVTLSHDSAVEAFRAHLSGTILAWLSLDDDNPRRHLVLRTRDWLTLANIPFSEALVEELAAARPARQKNVRTRTAGPARRAISRGR